MMKNSLSMLSIAEALVLSVSVVAASFARAEAPITPNDSGVIGRDDAASIQNAIDRAVKTGVRQVVIPADNGRTGKSGWAIGRSVLLPSGITVVIDNATLTLEKGVYANFFRTEHTLKPEGLLADHEMSGIRILGRGTAVLDGGEANDLTEGTQRKNGRPTVRMNSPIYVTNARDVEISGLTIRSPRYWGLCFEYCRDVRVRDIRFEAFCDRNNQDGIDLRNGCCRFLIENITGQTGDDTIALSAIDGASYAVSGRSGDIVDVTIRNVCASAPSHPVLAIRNHNGAKVRRVIAENLSDAPQLEPCFRDRGRRCERYALVRLGDGRYWRTSKSVKGDLADIHLKNLICRYSERGVVINSSLVDSTIENLQCHGPCREALTTEGPVGGTGATLENVTMRQILCETERFDSVVFDRLCLNPGDTVRNVRLENAVCRRPDGMVARIESQTFTADGPVVPKLEKIVGLTAVEGELTVDAAQGTSGYAVSAPLRCGRRPETFTMHNPWGHAGISVSYLYAPDVDGRPGAWRAAPVIEVDGVVRESAEPRRVVDVGAGWLKYRIDLKIVGGVNPHILTQRIGDALVSGWRNDASRGAAADKKPPEAASLKDAVARDHKILGTDDWYGCRRTVFDFEGYEAWVVEPKPGVKIAQGNPWTWTMQWATAYVPRTSVPRIVNEYGWRHATIITFKDKMNQHGLEVSKRFQDYLVGSLGFNPKANLIGMSWGGFYSIRYAVTYPQAVNRIYLDCPLVCFNKPKSRYSYGPWEAERPADDDWMKHPGMPLNLTAKLAATRIPVLLLYGGFDMTLPPASQAEEFIRRFTAAGGNLRYTKRGMYGHHPHGVEINENTIIDFFRGQTRDSALESAFERLAASVHGGERTATFLHRGSQEERDYLRKVGPCAVCEFTLRPTPGSEIHAKLILPPPEKWNGRFWGIGNTGPGTGVGSDHVRLFMLPRFNEGSAVCEADMGTANGRHGPEVIRDFGWRAAHLMTVEAKKLIAEFYGSPARKCYFYGLSSGGGQGLHEATRFPDDYDGIVSYVPAHYRTWHARRGRELHRGEKLPEGRRPFMYKIFHGPSDTDEYNMDDAAFERFIAAIRDDVDIPGEDLSAFAARGGKLIVVSGLKDDIVDPKTAERFARGVVAKAGGAAAAAEFFRLYQLPGRGHTRAAEVGGVEDIPATRAMEAWVEKGEAPAALTGNLKGGGEKPVYPAQF